MIVPTRNRPELLRQTLASLQLQDFHAFECIVVDDASTDGSDKIVEYSFPQARLIRQPINGGFGGTMNRGAREASGGILICLNNDLVPKPPVIAVLIRPLVENSRLFGATGKTVDWKDASANHLNMAARWNGSTLDLTHENSFEPAPTMFLQGGSCTMRRQQFLEFDGFSD